jgi:glycosyltransferase involved in cell wall biosynthesis
MFIIPKMHHLIGVTFTSGFVMHIINAMFSRGLGGIEQSFIDYCEAIKGQGNKVTAIIHPDAAVRSKLQLLGINIINVKNCGPWDIFAKLYIKKILKQTRPDAVILHGNRALQLIKSTAQSISIPVVGVTHNYSLERQIGVDAVFATTEDLRKKIIQSGHAEKAVYIIPNMVKLPPKQNAAKPFHTPPVIGTMGRFVKKKGFDIFLQAIKKLKEEGIEVKAIIGGTGEEETALKELGKSLGVDDRVEFTGWVNNKIELFDNIDIFCLPSLHEPFGIILLEAFMSVTPVITTNSEGPSEIATDNKDSLIIQKGDNDALAKAIQTLISDQNFAHKLALEALETVKNYDMASVGKKINAALCEIVIK